MSNRVSEITMGIVNAIRAELVKHEVTFEEYRAGFGHLIATQQAGEIPLLVDVFFNSTIVDIENAKRKGTKAAIQGPYFLPDAPEVDGEIAIRSEDQGHPRMILTGKVTDLSGAPLRDAVIDVWHSTPDGKYSGIHDNIELKYYRGKIRTGADGTYRATSLLPVPYQIPNEGPTGELLEKHMEYHSWRPAHVHYWVQADGQRDVISQAYLEGGDWVDDDCCNGVADHLIPPVEHEGDVRVIRMDFALEPALAAVAAE